MFAKIVAVVVSVFFFGMVYQNIAYPVQPVDHQELTMWWVLGVPGSIFFSCLLMTVLRIQQDDRQRVSSKGGSS